MDGEWLLVSTGFLLGWRKNPGVRKQWWLHSLGTILKILNYTLAKCELQDLWIISITIKGKKKDSSWLSV